MTSIVRIATEQDLHQLAPYFQEDPRWLNWAVATLRRRGAVILVAEREGRAVGYCAVHIGLRGYQAQHDGLRGWTRHRLFSADARPDAVLRPMTVGHIDALWVEPAQRRQGLASALVANSTRWLEAMGASEIQVAVDCHDQVAQGLFRRLGFDPMQTRMRMLLEERQELISAARRAGQADLPQLAELMRQEVEHQKQLAGFFELLPDVDWRHYVAAKLGAPDIGLFVAEHDGRLAGFVEACVTAHAARGSGRRLLLAASHMLGYMRHFASGSIEDIYVLPALRRHDIASALVACSYGWFRSWGVREVHASIWAGNEASLRFFSRLGFEPVKMTMRRSGAGMKAGTAAYVLLDSIDR